MREFADSGVPGARRRACGVVRIGVTLSPGREVGLAVGAEGVGLPSSTSRVPGTEATIAAAVSTATTTVRLIVGLHVGDENPVTLAEEIAVLDNLSNEYAGVIAELGSLSSDDAAEDVSSCGPRGRGVPSPTAGSGGRFRRDSPGTSLPPRDGHSAAGPVARSTVGRR